MAFLNNFTAGQVFRVSFFLPRPQLNVNDNILWLTLSFPNIASWVAPVFSIFIFYSFTFRSHFQRPEVSLHLGFAYLPQIFTSNVLLHAPFGHFHTIKNFPFPICFSLFSIFIFLPPQFHSLTSAFPTQRMHILCLCDFSILIICIMLILSCFWWGVRWVLWARDGNEMKWKWKWKSKW